MADVVRRCAIILRTEFFPQSLPNPNEALQWAAKYRGRMVPARE